ncbi:unnamed protein product [Rotaria sp. Silwood1]|nr:unnamed protein product [Rotaria sp. Silwood1]
MTTSCALTEHELLYDTLGHKLYLALTPFIICIGLIGNILTVCVFILTDLKRQSVSIITIALAIADSFVLLIPVSILWLEKILKRELTDLSPFWCRTHGFFDLTFTSCSSWLMVCIAFERFCAVCLYDSMGMFSVIINYILPFMFVLLLNSTVIYRLCQRGIVELTSSITVMLTLVCLVHLFCTLPFQCWWIYYEIPDQTGDCIWLKKKLTWRTITFTIRNINYMANFFLYSCSSKLFRNELKSLIFLSLLPHEKYQNYHYRRQSLYDNMQQQRISLTHLVMRRLSRTTDFTNVGIFHSGTNVTPANNPNGNI